jgi:acetyltransferase-like isoleucine patch superfamily enzyme
MILSKLIPASIRKRLKFSKLKKLGVKIGKNTQIFTSIDNFGTEPYLISIGSNCVVSGNVHFFTHDGGVNVINHLKRTDVDKIAPILIGDNVFIGYGTLILPGVHIGSNTIVGAGSVITKNIPDGVVFAGTPAHLIGTIQDYWSKNQDIFISTHSMNQKKKKQYLLSIQEKKN